jgi:hypothetical protein
MLDLFFLLLTITFFLTCFALLALCKQLMEEV